MLTFPYPGVRSAAGSNLTCCCLPLLPRVGDALNCDRSRWLDLARCRPVFADRDLGTSSASESPIGVTSFVR